MAFDSPDIDTFKNYFDNCVASIKKHNTDSPPAIKIQSLLNITVYVLATRFLEASVKHIVYNCCIMRGDTANELETLAQRLSRFNNPEYPNIKQLIRDELGIDITDGKTNGYFDDNDIRNLQQIVQNRHRNVHASFDSTEWYNSNNKDLGDLEKELPGLLNVLCYMELIKYERTLKSFVIK